MRCHLPWTQAFVNANGVVAPCCAPLELGNLAESSVSEIFGGSQFQTLRSDMAKGGGTAATRYCDDCYALKKYTESGYTFDVANSVGGDTDAALQRLRSSHPEFVANYELVREAYRAASPVPEGARPLRLEVQLGEHCDLRCIMCWQDHARPRSLKQRTFDEIAALLPYAQNVLFTGGEPTIYKNFWKLLETFKDTANPQACLQILTHGLHLKEHLDKFDGLGNVGFCINVDGPDKATYEKIRAGSNWEKLNDSLAAVADACRTRPGWGMNTTFLLMKSNIDKIDASIDFAERFGANWSCGMIAGESTPIAQCRTYFQENIFRFDHLGYGIDDIVDRLESATARARQIENPAAAELALSSLQATIQQARASHQIHVPARKAASMLALTDDRELSRRIQRLVNSANEERAPSVRQLGRTAVSTARRHGKSSTQYADAILALGIRHFDLDDDSAAVGHLQRAVTLLDEASAGSEALPEAGRAKLFLGRCLARLNDPRAAELLRAAWNLSRLIHGSPSSAAAEAALELGKRLNQLGEHNEAIAPLKFASENFTRLYGRQENSSFVAVSSDELGSACLALEFPEAEAHLRKALKMYETMWGARSGLAVETARKLLMLYRRSDRSHDCAALGERFPQLFPGHDRNHRNNLGRLRSLLTKAVKRIRTLR